MPEKRATTEQQQAFDAKQPGPSFEVFRGGEFVADFAPLPQVVEGLITRGAVLTLTGPTGHGKTAACTLLTIALVTGRRFAGRTVEAGQVIVLCGENADDYRLRLLATMEAEELEPADLDDIHVVPSRFDIETELPHLQRLAAKLPNLVAVIVDTSASYFQGGDENDNATMHRHAAGLRELTRLAGYPAVLVLCHPTKTPTQDNLLPRGGGSFLAEVDGNLTLWRDASGVAVLHWAGKLRGPAFDPIAFRLEPWELKSARFPNGRPIPAVVAVHVSDDEAERLERRQEDDENRLLRAMRDYPRESMSGWAMRCGFTKGLGEPLKYKVQRLLKALEADKLVINRRRRWYLTTAGKDAAGGLD
ncbi:AAA family ATPase [Cupriavidus metallidurans]|uniref:AAA family ATPase n=1 Tax=Cupriavidus metallidurans TaxID=119219 RepID=UPI003CFE3B51